MIEELELEFKKEKLKGILIKEDKEYLTLKLSNGYNSNLLKKEIKILSRKEIKETKKKSIEIKTNSKLPKISILHTGGTIASKVDYSSGAVISKFTPDELLNLFPELNELAKISAKMIAEMWSEDMRFSHYNLLLKEIDAIKEGAEGIIISHGTDMIGYSASALQYAIHNSPIPIIIVAAQRSADRPSSDSYSNLNAAITFILNLKGQYKRVGLCMHSKINDTDFLLLDGINISKIHTSRRDTFKQINYEAFAEMKKGKVEIKRKIKMTEGKFSFDLYDEKLKIGIFKSHPNLDAKELDMLSYYDAVIFEGSGLGHLGINEIDSMTKENGKVLESLNQLSKSVTLVMGSQCTYGRVNMDVYSCGRKIQEAGVLGQGMNLNTESLYSRVAYCMSKDRKNFKEVWDLDLEGFEIRSLDIDSD